MRTIEEVLFSLYFVEGMAREECPLSDAELEKLRKMPEFTKSERWIDFEYRLVMKLESADKDSR